MDVGCSSRVTAQADDWKGGWKLHPRDGAAGLRQFWRAAAVARLGVLQSVPFGAVTGEGSRSSPATAKLLERSGSVGSLLRPRVQGVVAA